MRSTPTGVFTLADASAAGWSQDAVRHAVDSGLWIRLHRGVFVPAMHVMSPLDVARAVHLATGGTPSHRTAARVLGFWTLGVGEHATVPADQHRRRRSGLTIHRDRLDEDEVLWVDGVPITQAWRTCRDLARENRPEEALCAVDCALRLGRIVPADLAALARSSKAAARIIPVVDARSESPLETCVRWRMLRAGIILEPQVEVAVNGMLYRLDLADRDRKVAVECDGQQVHGAPQALYADRIRANDLVAAGWVLVRVTWWDLWNRPQAMVEQVRAVLAARPHLRSRKSVLGEAL